jgi:hypothetical protein
MEANTDPDPDPDPTDGAVLLEGGQRHLLYHIVNTPVRTCLNPVFLLCLPLLCCMTLGQWVFLTHDIYYSTVSPLNYY